MKVKGKELIFKIVSLCTTVLTFVGLAFKFAYQSTVVGGHKIDAFSGSITRGDWWDMVNEGLEELSGPGYTFWQFAKVFLIVSLVVLAILAVLTVVEFFFSHKYLSLAKRIVSVVAIVSVVVFFATLVIGGLIVANKETVGVTEVTLLPNVGAWFIFVFGLVASVMALLDKKKA